MPFQIIHQDITKMNTDAIVNAANSGLQMGGGVCGAIFRAAGPGPLQQACDQIGGCPTGSAVITPGFNLQAKYVIHAVGPVWRGGSAGERELLAGTYRRSLELAAEHGLRSISFPLISSGIYGYPKVEALRVAMDVFAEFLADHEMDIYLAVFDRSAVEISEKLFTNLAHYIDTYYVEEPRRRRGENFSESIALEAPLQRESHSVLSSDLTEEDEDERLSVPAPLSGDKLSTASKAATEAPGRKMAKPTCEMPVQESRPASQPAPQPARKSAPEPGKMPLPGVAKTLPQKKPGHVAQKLFAKRDRKLEDVIKNLEETFSEMLLRLIDEKGKTDVEVYKKANVDRKLFSKIRTNKDYNPKKSTAIALAIGLELSLDETIDLLAKAGYSLSPSSKFDVIIRYFIEREEYDIFEINEALFCFEQPLLGV